jgi:DNA-binding transcriptional ArsR family regulator
MTMSKDLGEVMGEETREIMGLNRMIHEPSRLAIMTILRRTAGADYLFIRRLTGLSKGNLSNHLAKLEEAGLVSIGKHFEGKKPVTTVSLTREGQATIEAYWTEMERIASESRRRPSENDEPTGSFGAGEAYGGATGA